MGYNTYTTDDLISDVLLFGHVPLGNNTFTSSQILRLATIEIQTPIMKQILSTRGGYYQVYEDFSDADQVQSGLFPIPANCVAGALSNIELVQNTSIIPVNPIVESEQFSTNSPTSTSYGYFMRGNYVQILPTPTVGVTRMWYSKRTSTLVATSAASQVQSINGAVITVGSVPSTMAVGTTVDVCGDQPPFNILSTREITDITGTDITLDAEVEDLEIGDWIALENQTPVPQVPVEYRIIVAQRVVCKICELQGYLDKMKAAKAVLAEYERDTMSLITPRVASSTKVINPVNGGFLSGNTNKISNYPAGRNS